MLPPATAPTAMPMAIGVIMLAIENTAPVAGRPGLDAVPVVAEGEGRSPEDDPHQRDDQRHEKGREQVGEGRRERREQRHDDQDEPHVVRLPHGPIARKIASRCSAARGPLASAVQTPAAEVRSAEHRVGDKAQEDHRRRQVLKGHRAPPAAGPALERSPALSEQEDAPARRPSAT